MEKILEEIGFTKGEIKVYLTLLELGSTTTGGIIKKSKVSPSKVYDILEKLIQKGVVNYVIKGKVKYFEAASPKRILEYLQEKEEKIKAQEKELNKVLPQLIQKQKLIESIQEAKVYKGWKGVQTAFNFILEVLKRGENYIGFVATEKEQQSKEVQLFFAKYHKKRYERGLKVSLIANEKTKHIFEGPIYKEFKNFHVKYVKHIVPTGTLIF